MTTSEIVLRSRKRALFGAMLAMISVLASVITGFHVLGVVMAAVGAGIVIVGGAPHDADLRASIARSIPAGATARKGHTLRWMLAIVTASSGVPAALIPVMTSQDGTLLIFAFASVAVVIALMLLDCRGEYVGTGAQA